MLTAIATFLGVSKLKAKIGAACLAALLAVGAVKIVENFFVTKERARVVAKGEKTRAKAADARSAVERMPDVDRVLSKYCRNC
jgi:hypothetical protein